MTKPRIMFAMQPKLGWKTYAATLKTIAMQRDDIDMAWVPMPPAGLLRHVTKRTNQSGLRHLIGRIDPLTGFANWAGRALRREVARFRPDIVHCAGHWIGAAVPENIPLSVTLDATRHGIARDLPAQVWTPADMAREDAFLRRVDLIWPMSHWAASTLPDQIATTSRCHVLPPSVPQHAPVTKTTDPASVPNIIFIGNDFARKGGDDLVAWVRGPLSGRCHLFIASAAAPALDHPDITVLGAVDNARLVADILPKMDIFCLPTRSDMSSWAVIEAASAGLVSVISGVGGIPELVVDGETGFLVPPDAPDGCLAALETLLNDPALYRRMGQAAKTKAMREFDAHVNYNMMIDRLITCAARAHAPRG